MRVEKSGGMAKHNNPRRSPNLTNRSVLTRTCLLLFFTLLFPIPLHAVGDVQGVSPSLSPGQWAHYALSGNEAEGVVDALFTVQRVDGANVTFSDLDTFSDRHTTTDTVIVSVSTGPTVPSSGEYFVISPQKQVGDSVYPGDPVHYPNLPIQDIAARPYVSASRQIAHVHAQNSSQVATTTTTTFEDFYWDDSTGIFTEIVKSLNGVVVLHVVMSSTSLWQPDLPPDPLLIPTAVVSLFSAVVIGVLLVGRYRKKAK
ncbi:hypothetical protein AUF78_17560 [archaeon 13_1_20CM_2_51_12]|nr:MAG: hypothetical protein AUF78_17560 [archaeon 13_1_20CM_2_51_12]